MSRQTRSQSQKSQDTPGLVCLDNDGRTVMSQSERYPGARAAEGEAERTQSRIEETLRARVTPVFVEPVECESLPDPRRQQDTFGEEATVEASKPQNVSDSSAIRATVPISDFEGAVGGQTPGVHSWTVVASGLGRGAGLSEGLERAAPGRFITNSIPHPRLHQQTISPSGGAIRRSTQSGPSTSFEVDHTDVQNAQVGMQRQSEEIHKRMAELQQLMENLQKMDVLKTPSAPLPDVGWRAPARELNERQQSFRGNQLHESFASAGHSQRDSWDAGRRRLFDEHGRNTWGPVRDPNPPDPIAVSKVSL